MSLDRQPGSASPASRDSIGLAEQIQAHEKADKHESLLHRGLSSIWDAGSSQSLKNLEKLQDEVNAARAKNDTAALQVLEKQAAAAVKSDKSDVEKRDTYLGYAGGALEMAAMALKQGIAARTFGLLGTAGLYGLDSARSGDNWQTRIADGALGAAKGVGLRALFQYSGGAGWNPAAQGVVTGLASRFADYATDRQMYQGKGIADGLASAAAAAADWHAMLIDGIAFGAGSKLFGAANAASGGRLEQSAIARSMVSSGLLGFTTGTSNEFLREQHANESFDIGKVLRGGLTQGALNSVAGLSGEIHADLKVRAPSHTAAAAGFAEARLSQTMPRQTTFGNVMAEKLAGIRDSFPPASGTPARDASRIEQKAEIAAKPKTIEAAQAQQFVVTKGADHLNEMINALRNGKDDPRSALLEVRKVFSDGVSAPRRMLVQHVTSFKDVQSVQDFARTSERDALLAMCFSKMAPAVRQKHVLPYDDRITLHTREENGQLRIAFTPEKLRVEGYEPAITLGEHSGQAAQHYLLRSLLKPVKPEEAETELGKLRTHIQEQIKNGTWHIIETEPDSAADRIGMDYILVNRKNGQYAFFDTTLNPNGKQNIAPVRQQGVIPIALEPGDFRAATQDTQLNFARRVAEAMNSESLFKVRDIPLPAWRTSATSEDLIEAMSRYHDAVGRQGNRFANDARLNSGEKRRDLERKEQLLADFKRDIHKARTFETKDLNRQTNPESLRQHNALTTAIDDTARTFVRQALKLKTAPSDLMPLNTRFTSGFNYDAPQDRLTVSSDADRFKIEDIRRRITRVVDMSVMSAADADPTVRTFLRGDSGIRYIRNQTLNLLGQRNVSQLLGLQPLNQMQPVH